MAYNTAGKGAINIRALDAATAALFADSTSTTRATLTADFAAPTLVVPPASCITASDTAWYGANFATFNRFQLGQSQTFRWINFRVGASSGNIQVGVSRFAMSGGAVTSTRVMSSGVIACPTGSSSARVDCGATLLTPGDYGLFLWCDNTTATFQHGLATGHDAARMSFGNPSSQGSGIPSTSLAISPATRWVYGLTLEIHS